MYSESNINLYELFHKLEQDNYWWFYVNYRNNNIDYIYLFNTFQTKCIDISEQNSCSISCLIIISIYIIVISTFIHICCICFKEIFMNLIAPIILILINILYILIILFVAFYSLILLK